MITTDNIISQALLLPPPAISYHVSQVLAEHFPHQALVEGSTYAFDFEAYAAEGLCALRDRGKVHNEIITEWTGDDEPLRREVAHAWLTVEWKQHSLELLVVQWPEGNCTHKHHWIIADTAETGEAFFESVCRWNSEVRGEILVFSSGVWYKSQELYQSIKNASWENLILRGAAAQEIRDDFQSFFDSRPLYDTYGIPWKRGALFLGPPGNGKTHTVKALINWLAKPCLYVKSFQSQWSTPHDNIRGVFKRARQAAPCILVLEDLDSLVDDKNRSYFLNELDGFAANTGIVTLATTNHPERLDPAILERPSRFDRKYFFELPTCTERLCYIQMWNRAMQSDLRLSECGVERAVACTEGFSFAYLKELFLSSMMSWVSSNCSNTMDEVLLGHVDMLREQMGRQTDETPPEHRETEVEVD